MRLTEESTSVMMSHPELPISAGSEHLFAWTLESLTGRHFLHGEIVALGIDISSWLQGRDHDQLRTALEDARVQYLPGQLGLSWAEIEHTLLSIGAYNRDIRHFNTVFDDVSWTPDIMRKLREMLFGE
jgi:glycerol dehydrogenase-like iron-containing ADH family enzyme